MNNINNINLTKQWSELGYELVITADGSPSLKSLKSTDSEVMHHRGGAAAETWYIYGKYVKFIHENGKARVFSLGLGLGYNEFIYAIYNLNYNQKNDLLLTFESEQNLKLIFLSYLRNQLEQQCEIHTTFDLVLQHIFLLTGFKGTREDVKNHLIYMLDNHKWLLQDELNRKAIQHAKLEKINLILYDAFSSKTSSELWEEEFLIILLNKLASENCVFTTYACTGSLKRALKAQNFQIIKRQGFSGKRDSTLATNFSEFFNILNDQTF